MMNICETERGNVSLSDGNGSEILWVMENNTAVLAVSFTPDNYPAWQVHTCNISSEDLAEHINQNLGGWYIRKMNIDGVKRDQDQVAEELE